MLFAPKGMAKANQSDWNGALAQTISPWGDIWQDTHKSGIEDWLILVVGIELFEGWRRSCWGKYAPNSCSK